MVSSIPGLIVCVDFHVPVPFTKQLFKERTRKQGYKNIHLHPICILLQIVFILIVFILISLPNFPQTIHGCVVCRWFTPIDCISLFVKLGKH